jgi:hypothetical protein
VGFAGFCSINIKFNIVKTIQTKFGTYFCDGLPRVLKEELDKFPKGFNLKEYTLCQRKVNHVNTLPFNRGKEFIAETRSWFNDKKQPSESQVRHAMIWGYDQYGDYQIKAGGESASDSLFSSHFRVEIANPRTGEDMDVVVLKKHSTSFKDVLITIKELEAIFDAAATPAQKQYQKMEDLHGILDLLIRYELGLKIDTTGGKKIQVPEKWYQMYMNQLNTDYSKSGLLKYRADKRQYALSGAMENPSFRKSMEILDRVIDQVTISDFETMQMALF